MSFDYTAAVQEIKADYDQLKLIMMFASQNPTTPDEAFKMQKQMEEIQQGMENASTRLNELNEKVMNIALSIKL